LLDVLIPVWGADRVGLHLAPRGDTHSMGDRNPAALFGAVAEGARARNLAFLCLREYAGLGSLGPQMKRIFGGPMIANENLTFDGANALLAAGDADAAAFGKQFIANPDLVRRFREQAPLNAPNPATFYADGAEGYTDYPALA
jgi:2,4-dienoyl-CoA reductase-like NADH-dependent reductase (Old Yellow Enzyme family)